MMGSERGSGEEKDWEESDERLHDVVFFVKRVWVLLLVQEYRWADARMCL